MPEGPNVEDTRSRGVARPFPRVARLPSLQRRHLTPRQGGWAKGGVTFLRTPPNANVRDRWHDNLTHLTLPIRVPSMSHDD